VRTTRSLAARWVAALVGVGLVGVGLPAPAYAHNQLTGSTPADGEVLDTAPASVTLDFLDSLVPANTTVTVTGPDRRGAAAGPPEFDGSTVTVGLRVSSAGRYTVGYELISADGHVGTGEVAFRLTAQAAPSPSPPSSPSPEPEPEPEPEPAAGTTPAAAAVPPPAEGGNGWLWVVASAAALLAGAAAVLLVVRRRGRRAERPGPA